MSDTTNTPVHESVTATNTPHETHTCGCGAAITVPFAKAVDDAQITRALGWPNVGLPAPGGRAFTPAPVVPPAPVPVSPNTLVLMDDKTVLLALDGLTPAQLYAMTEYLNDDYPEFRWVVVGVVGGTRVADLRGDPDLTAKAQVLWDRARADLTPG